MTPKLIKSLSVHQVAAAMQDQIRTEELPVGIWLPSERDLAAAHGVHRRVIREAIALLAEQGWLLCRPRHRPVVLAGPATTESASPGKAFALPPKATGAGARLVALIMWHGGSTPGTTAQQRIFWGFQRALDQAGYHGVFLNLGEAIGTEEENAAREAARLTYAVEHQFAGIGFYPYAYRSNRELIRQTGRQVPLTLIDRLIPGIETDYVGIDNLSAIQDATHHLLAQGHHRIALVTQTEAINSVQDRILGYRTAMRRAQTTGAERVITVDSALEWQIFDHIMRLPDGERPTALLCVNDAMALSAAQHLSALGLSVPQDMALVGIDDLVQTLPNGVGLTSIAQPFEEIGAQAARFLLERIADPNLPSRHLELPTTLSVRASSDIAAKHSFGADLVPKTMLDRVPQSC
jgi:GntR family transcriptional regulator of arabinose operon